MTRRRSVPMSPIGCTFRAAPHRRYVKTLAVATFSLLWLASTEAWVAEPSTSCRDEVAAAFERLRTSGRPYRKKVTSDVSDPFAVGDRKILRETAEFLAPDRMREIMNITTNGVVDRENETIRVGQRVWSNWTGWPWGWRTWDPFLLRGREPGSELADTPVPADAVFECLGTVEFEGTAYLGYRGRIEKRFEVVVPHNGALNDPTQQELLRKLRQLPQEWRTIFVDPQTALPAYDLAAQENQLDNPSHKVQYSYPTSIKIEPPLWCRLGLCRSVLR
ncbi:MAG: hypothetical protein J2P54_12090 [Bradyrhizobiaceae bacterium]|nr:hypothetical protein [Bradyrhizobiaceae bacterium]